MIAPSPIQFLSAMWRLLRRALRGDDLLAPDFIVRKRRAICDKCPFKVDEQCFACTCFIEPKTMLLSEDCPLRKW